MYTSQATFLFQTVQGEGITVVPRLEVRFLAHPGVEDDLTHLPIDRRGTPFPAAREQELSVDDQGIDAEPREIALSLLDPNAPVGEGPLFRSGTLSNLPTPPPADPNGFLHISVPDAVTVTFAALNTIATGALSGGPGVVLTGATITAAPDGGLQLTATGTGPTAIPGAPPPPTGLGGLGTLAFVYTAALKIVPFTDAFQAARLVTASTSGASLTFSATPGGSPLVGVTNEFLAAFMNLVSPVVLTLLRDNVEGGLTPVLDSEIRTAAMALLPIAGTPAPPSATVSIQRITVSSAGLTVLGTLGVVGPLLPPRPGPGCVFGGAGVLVILVGATLRTLMA